MKFYRDRVRIVRYLSAGSVAVGVQRDGVVHRISGATVGGLLRLGRPALREALAGAGGAAEHVTRLLPPVDGRMEVWAAGVTYQRSRAARMEESERSATVYELVYDAPRPELFFKSAAWRVCGDGEPVSIRADSTVDVPEPELALVLSPAGEVVGYTVCNDLSSRSIEGANPLYLPQAKVYLGGCAVGPGIRPAWEVPDPYNLAIALRISRAGDVVWSGTASTAQLHRRFEDLVEHLFRADEFPDGAILSTGTCLVPDLPFTLRAGDEITIEIESVGVLRNVVSPREAMGYLAARTTNHFGRALN
jgi:2-dehydro-3-deoxy-D-arabinonate dehydratase